MGRLADQIGLLNSMVAQVELQSTSHPQRQQGSPNGGNATPPGDNAGTINWSTVEGNLDAISGTTGGVADVDRLDVMFAHAPAQRYWGTP